MNNFNQIEAGIRRTIEELICTGKFKTFKTDRSQRGSGKYDHISKYANIAKMSTGAQRYCSPSRSQASQQETDINECDSSPCQNGGICTDHLNYYTCRCLSGFSGPTCNHEINECDSGPCKNGAFCQDRVNGYTCDCPPGLTGLRCETDINECASGPCENGGTCRDRINSYTCVCRSGYEGASCEHETTVNQVLMLILVIIISIMVIWLLCLGCKMLLRALMDNKYERIKNND
ncbi:Fibropellin-3 [Holothuria leucospilota]|uniref:Fibropellin-3 n=1 Tax=Holothuria leucospilota TaxID=206669 RepID=A0A9Q0YAJ4_HOLLE|nr:Fibropellin-3 [Holothuria leucospilota]